MPSISINMKSHFLVFVLIIKFLVVLPSAGVTYYVKPSQISSQCPGQPCQTLQYYFDNANTTLNQEMNITMDFLTGKHIVSSNSHTITTPNIMMIGYSEESDVQIILRYQFGLLTFFNNTVVVLRNLTFIGWYIAAAAPKMTEFLMSSVILLHCDINTYTTSPALRMENLVAKDGRLWDFSATDSEGVTMLSLTNCTFYGVYPIVIEGKITARVRDCIFIKSSLSITEGSLILSGATVFRDNTYNSAILSDQGNVTLSDTIFFVNNSAFRGGAMALYSSTLNIDANTVVTFKNNSALQSGGAIYIAPGIIPTIVLILDDDQIHPYCPYHLLNCSISSTYNFIFEGNSATNGGDDIYGISQIIRHSSESNDLCRVGASCNLTTNSASFSNSSISSDPLRVCMCDHDGKSQCINNSYIFSNYSIYPGEEFTLSAVVVGGDFGLTLGTVYGNFVEPNNSTSLWPDYGQEIRSISTCTNINYILYSRTIYSSVIVYFTTVVPKTNSKLATYTNCNHNVDCLLQTSVFMKFTILPCPPGFILLDNPPRCDCYSVFTETLNVTCRITNGTGYFSWMSELWMNVQENETIYGEYCPHNYCKKGIKQIDVRKSSNSQCDFTRAGRLCGKCIGSYSSLAIGSSKCIHCQTNNNLALITFFVVAGFLLVFSIGILNITVTQGTIDGLIFYANIVWTYKDILFTQEGSKNAVMTFLKTFIAWLNLDFGIEICFVKGLTAFWKTWLQYVFPFYIWIIAGLIIVATRHSIRLTNILGNRAVPLLATLFLLSYMKLLHVAVSSLEFSILSRIDHTVKYASKSLSPIIVWSVDGNLAYFEFPHILLFVAGLFIILFLWMPYTLLLFLMQLLRRLPQYGLLKCVMRFNPLYDAYFAPLKDKHHYWFGALLLTRGILLVMFASSFAIPQDINLLMLLIFGIFLVYYMVLSHPYKRTGILILQSTYIMNLTLLSGIFFFSYRQPNASTLQSVAIGLSTGLVFIQFCGTVTHAVIAPWCCQGQRRRQYKEECEHHDHTGHRAMGDVDNQTARGYRDSILDDSDGKRLLPV